MQKWDDQFDSELTLERVIDEWAVGLAGLSAGQIKLGIDAARVRCKWPPSIAEFVEFAKGDVMRGAAYRPFVALPRPKSSPVLAAAAIAEMRAGLRGSG